MEGKVFKVLIIDDDTEFDQKLSEKLKSAGLDTVTTVTGEEALEYVKSNDVDFIILDFVMPQMDGDEFYRKLKHDMRKNIPTIVLTNFSTLKPSENLEVYIKNQTDLDDLARRIKERLEGN